MLNQKIAAAQAELEIQRLKNVALRQQLEDSRRNEKDLTEHNRELQRTVLERDRQLAELGIYADIAAYNLETPVALIRGYSDLLVNDLDGVLMGDPMDWLKNVQQAGRKLHRIIDDLLAVAGLQMDGIHPHIVDMGTVVRNAAQNLRQVFDQRAVELCFDSSDWPEVIGYSSWLELVYIKLLTNAIQRLDHDGPAEIHLSATSEGDRGCFIICDYGNPLPEESLQSLFEPASPLPAQQTTHLNLSIVKRILMRVGGTIRAENNLLERGASFYFTLPLVQA